MVAWPNRVSIGDFVGDLDGSDWRGTLSMAGWTDAPSVRPSIADRAQQDGGWDASGFYGARVVTISGTVDQTTAAAAKAVADSLTALSPRSSHELIVDHSAIGPRSAMVRVSKGAVLEWSGPNRFRYTIELTAPDPLKYGAPAIGSTSLASTAGGTGRTWPRVWPTDYGVPAGVTPGAVAVANAGTATYWTRLRIDGPVPNPTVTLVETGDWIKYTGTVAAGQWLDVDTANRRVLLNGQVSVRHLVSDSGNWLGVPPGGGSIRISADAADPAASLSVWSYEGAWL